jgi:hypothetical protein
MPGFFVWIIALSVDYGLYRDSSQYHHFIPLQTFYAIFGRRY